MKKNDKSNIEGLTKEKKELLKAHLGSASSKIDLNDVREWWKRGEEGNVESDWDKLANIAEKAMKVNDFTIDDVRDDLKEHREKNKDSVGTREIPRITGKDAERFMESVRRNNESMEERKAHLKKSIENAAKINNK